MPNKPMQKLVALKRMKYDTRRLEPGDTFEAKPAHASLWVKLKMAKDARQQGTLDAPPPALSRRVRRSAPKRAVADDAVESAGTSAPVTAEAAVEPAPAPEPEPAPEPVQEAPTIETNPAPQESPTDPELNTVDGPDNPQPKGAITRLPQGPRRVPRRKA